MKITDETHVFAEKMKYLAKRNNKEYTTIVRIVSNYQIKSREDIYMKILVVVAHPNLTQSHANRMLMEEVEKHAGIDVHVLSSAYVQGQLNVKKEQEMLEAYDRIVLQFPFYWYNVPALLKKWLEDILTPGWAYSKDGDKLAKKEFILAITTGGSKDGYQAGGYNWHTISEYTFPIQATITRCQGVFLPSFVVYDTKSLMKIELKNYGKQYVDYIKNYKYVPFGH